MDHECRALFSKERVILSFLKCNHICCDFSIHCAVLTHFYIFHITCMGAIRVVHAVVCICRIIMSARRLEVRQFTRAGLMVMESMFARREGFTFQCDLDLVLPFSHSL